MIVMMFENIFDFSPQRKKRKREERREMHQGTPGGMIAIGLSVI
jgi:hypothetical protein